MSKNQPRNGLWQSLPLRNDRLPNELNDVAQLWQTLTDPQHPMNQSTPTFFRTAFGNINGDGNPTSFSSPILGMRNTHLNIALEPRIAPLVNLMKDFGLVTYSSCEGHLIKDCFYEAYAGFLYKYTGQPDMTTFLQAAENSGFLAFRTWLVDSLDGTKYKTVELYFSRDSWMDIEHYHGALVEATKRMTASLHCANTEQPNDKIE